MSLKQTLKKEKISAMKNKDRETLETLNLVLSNVQNVEIQKKNSELSDLDVQTVIKKEVKQTEESLEYAVKGNKEDEVQKLNKRVEFLNSFLPEQMSEEDVKKEVSAILESEGITGRNQMGEAMRTVMPKLKGKADGKLINQVVKDLLK